MSPPTDPPRSAIDHLVLAVPGVLGALQGPKVLAQVAMNLCGVIALLLLVIPLEAIGVKVGLPLTAGLPWWGFLALSLLAGALYTYLSNRQELERRNGMSRWLCMDEECGERVPPEGGRDETPAAGAGVRI